MKILLPTTIPLEIEIPAGVTVAHYDVTQPIPAEYDDAEALVAWGNSDSQLQQAASQLRSLRWVQTLAAGPDAIVNAGFTADAILTSGRSLHNGPVAEHALSLVLAAARQLHALAEHQRDNRWASEFGGIRPERNPDVFTTLRGSSVLIWGFGGIAQTIAPLLTGLGATVTGVAQSARETDGYPVISVDDIEKELPGVDVLLMILPSTAGTNKVLSAERIALLPKHAWVVNVGRGSTIDEEALIEALRERRIGGAALDVTTIEPLPAESPLWGLPNTIITPHTAGGRPIGASALISQNLAALVAGTPLRNVVTP